MEKNYKEVKSLIIELEKKEKELFIQKSRVEELEKDVNLLQNELSIALVENAKNDIIELDN